MVKNFSKARMMINPHISCIFHVRSCCIMHGIHHSIVSPHVDSITLDLLSIVKCAKEIPVYYLTSINLLSHVDEVISRCLRLASANPKCRPPPCVVSQQFLVFYFIFSGVALYQIDTNDVYNLRTSLTQRSHAFIIIH